MVVAAFCRLLFISFQTISVFKVHSYVVGCDLVMNINSIILTLELCVFDVSGSFLGIAISQDMVRRNQPSSKFCNMPFIELIYNITHLFCVELTLQFCNTLDLLWLSFSQYTWQNSLLFFLGSARKLKHSYWVCRPG